MRSNLAIGTTGIAAAVGLVFASVSTHDFVQHLDRQVHGLQCSFVPGVAEADTTGESGCYLTLMSPYSSVFRDSLWGGIPVSLPAMAVFAFLFAWALFLLLVGRQRDRWAIGFTLLAWGLPVLASVVMGYLALVSLDAACKLCIGIYVASAIGFGAAVLAMFFARRPAAFDPISAVDRLPDETVPYPEDLAPSVPSLGWGALGGAFAVGVAFVAGPVAAYAGASPDFSQYVGTCGRLENPADDRGVLVSIGPQTRSVPVIEVLDPLCPACRSFEHRFSASSVAPDASRKALLFPLDDRCNWMVDRAIHPGACAVSEAILCAGDDAEEVLAWAFEEQGTIVEAAERDPDAAVRIVRERYPALASCIGSPAAQARLNQSLRWAVQNELPVLTPQVYVGDLRLCDADTDLGMEYALSRLVRRYRAEGPREAGTPDSQSSERAPSLSLRGGRPAPAAPRPRAGPRPASTPAPNVETERQLPPSESSPSAPDRAAGSGSPSTGEPAPAAELIEAPASTPEITEATEEPTVASGESDIPLPREAPSREVDPSSEPSPDTSAMEAP